MKYYETNVKLASIAFNQFYGYIIIGLGILVALITWRSKLFAMILGYIVFFMLAIKRCYRRCFQWPSLCPVINACQELLESDKILSW